MKALLRYGSSFGLLWSWKDVSPGKKADPLTYMWKIAFNVNLFHLNLGPLVNTSLLLSAEAHLNYSSWD